MPLATSESGALKLGSAPLRILLPDREIRQRGIRSKGVNYPAVPLSRFSLTTYPAVPLIFSHLPCCALNCFRTYPAVPLFFFFALTLVFPCLPCCASLPLFFYALTLLCTYFSAYSCSGLIPLYAYHLYPAMHTLILLYAYPVVLFFFRTYPAVRLFYFHSCCGLIFLRTYPCCALFYFHLPCCAHIFLRTYPAMITLLLCPYSAAICKTFSAPCALLTARITLALRLRLRGVGANLH